MHKSLIVVCVISACLFSPTDAFALINGGEGNQPVDNPRWPKGVSAVHNHPSRVAWWNGGGFAKQISIAEGRGDTATLSFLLHDFSQIDAPIKQVFLHDGEGQSFWLNQNRQPDKREKARIDWKLSVALGNGRAARVEFGNVVPEEADSDSFPPRLDLYSAHIDWDTLIIPDGVEVIDNRLSSHGYTEADRHVIEGTIKDLTTGQPMSATINILEDLVRQPLVQLPAVIATTTSGQDGKWVIKKLPPGRIRIVVEANGFAPRLIATKNFEEQPSWSSYPTTLARTSPLTGIVTDNAGVPLERVNVRIIDVKLKSGERYSSPFSVNYKTDKDGRFEALELPECSTVMSIEDPKYAMVRRAVPAEGPRQGLEFRMPIGSSIKLKVDFSDRKQPYVYQVALVSKGLVGGELRKTAFLEDDGHFTFEGLSPGTYTVKGIGVGSTDQWPTAAETVQIAEGESREVTLTFKQP